MGRHKVRTHQRGQGKGFQKACCHKTFPYISSCRRGRGIWKFSFLACALCEWPLCKMIKTSFTWMTFYINLCRLHYDFQIKLLISNRLNYGLSCIKASYAYYIHVHFLILITMQHSYILYALPKHSKWNLINFPS